MGWLYSTKWQKRKDLIADRTKDHAGKLARWCCLKHCYRGNAYRGVLWTVWELSRLNYTGEVTSTERYICCGLIAYSKLSPASFGYKDISEEYNPYYYSCPLSYLDMVPVACQEWRDNVIAYHADRKPKFKLRLGQKVKLKGLVYKTAIITNTKPLLARLDNGHVRKLQWKYIEAPLIQMGKD